MLFAILRLSTAHTYARPGSKYEKVYSHIPTTRSANAILITRDKTFLRSFLLTAKRTIVKEFPAIIKTASNAKAVHHAIPSAFE